MASVMKKLILSTFSLIIGAGSFSWAHTSQTTEKHWARTGLTFKKLETIALNSSCHNSPKHYQGCIDIINALSTSAETTRILVPKTEELQGVRVIKSFGRSKIIEFNKTKDYESHQAQILRHKAYRRSLKNWSRRFLLKQHETDLRSIGLWAFHTYVKKSGAPISHLGEALNSYLSALYFDNSGLIPLDVLNEDHSPTNQIAGIGIEYRSEKNGIRVLGIIPGSPASRTVLKINDIITNVGKHSLASLPESEVSALLTGTPKSAVNIRVSRDGKKMASPIRVVRDVFEHEKVRYRKLAWTHRDLKMKFGYIEVDSFNVKNLHRWLKKKIAQAMKDQVNGLILDLSNNYGGYIVEALYTLELFLGSNKILMMERPLAENEQRKVYLSSAPAFTDLPLVVVINSQSASASEIVAGALAEHKRALLVGDRSFGKGTVQTLHPYPHLRKTLFKKTTATYLLPSGRNIHLSGILPHKKALDRTAELGFLKNNFRLKDYSVHPVQGSQMKTAKHDLPVAVNHCIQSYQAADKEFLKHKVQLSHDYRLLVAKDVLACKILAKHKHLLHRPAKVQISQWLGQESIQRFENRASPVTAATPSSTMHR